MKKILKYVEAFIVLLAIATLAMLFVTAIKVGDTAYNGMKTVFGYTSKTSVDLGFLGSWSNETKVFGFSFMNLLTYALALLVAVASIFAGMKKNKNALLVVVLFGIAAGILFLFTADFVSVNENFVTLYNDNVKLGAGPIVGCICMFVSALAAGAKYVLGSRK